MDQKLGRRSPRAVIASSLGLALVLGLITLVVWLLVGRQAFQGGAFHVLADRGLLVYAVLAVAWAAVGFVAGLWPLRGRGSRDVALLAALAWLAQGAIVVLLGPLLADELRSILGNALIWLIATGIVLQPIAAFAGARLGAKVAWGKRRTEGSTLLGRGSQR